MRGYTVIDLETTGFSPKKHHRVIELGVVHVSPTGQIEDEWSTLVNPGRDISNSHVHEITASHVVAADPNSQSGKAAKALAYSIPIIAEEAWERLEGVLP
ncbi:exonuclease domain-containing protein [Brachybacterium timonense]|uniref:exonuclease domain-containing protein n=1 Tax=Brachybacterium timonense TaxID=2050896 RepID=UPI000D0BD2CC|nr:exonuclease domain-containing protein [Brachybacterium timonense]